MGNVGVIEELEFNKSQARLRVKHGRCSYVQQGWFWFFIFLFFCVPTDKIVVFPAAPPCFQPPVFTL